MSTSLRPDPWPPAGKDTATNAQRNLGPDIEADADLGDAGNIVTIEQGRERRARRDGSRAKGDRADRSEARQERADRSEAKQDRADRRERRRSGKGDEATAAGGSDSATADAIDEPAAAADSAEVGIAEAASSAVAVVEAPAAASRKDAPPRGALVPPILDSAASPRIVDRTRYQLEQAEHAIANAPEVVGLVAPLVRHVNTVTEQLNEAQMTVGRLMAERDSLRARLAEVEGVSVDEVALMTLPEAHADGDPSTRRLQRIEARQSALMADDKKPSPLRPVFVVLGFAPEDDSFESLQRMARRRQLFAAVLMVSAFTILRILSAQGQDFSKISRDGLADIQGVGMIFQVFLMAWMLYRIVRVGGKGVSWLFPDPNGRKRRR